MPERLSQRYQQVQNRLHEACNKAFIAHSNVRLLAVSKTQPTHAVKACYDLGQRAFGENYLQDALVKIKALAHLDDIQWHFIGPLQSNKTKAVAENFNFLETLSRIKIAEKLDKQRPRYLAPLNVLVQINISNEPQKEGLGFEQANEFCAQIQHFKRLKLRGLMCIAQNTRDESVLRKQYKKMNTLFNELKTQYSEFDYLSMGMSNDMELAIEQGSNEVRIGTDIFGKRNN